MANAVPVRPSNVRYVLRPVNGGYKIDRLVGDNDFDPPIWVRESTLNGGRKFGSREAAREYMIRTTDERQARDAA